MRVLVGVLIATLSPGAFALADSDIAFGRKVTNKALFEASRNMELAQALGLNVTKPWIPPDARAFKVDPWQPLSSRHWCMLTFEADAKLATATNPHAVDAFLESIGKTKADLDEIKAEHEATDAELRRAALVYLRIISMVENGERAGVAVADKDIREIVEAVRTRVVARAGVLDAGYREPGVPEPTEQQLRAHYEQYRSTDPRRSPNGIGYLLTRQVMMDIVAVRIDDISPKISVTEQELEQFWSSHHDEFWIADDGEQMADKAKHVLPRFRNRVTDALKLAKIHARALPAMQTILRELAEPFNGAKTDAQGFMVAPQEVRSQDYLRTIVGKVAKDYGAAITVTRTEYIPVAVLSQVPVIGRATATDHRGKKVKFEYLVRRAKGVLDLPRSRQDTFALGLFQASPAVLATKYDGRDRDLFIYRVVDVKSAEPASFDSIRGQVRNDWRFLKAQEQIQRDAAAWAQAAREVGLGAGWASLAEQIRRAYSRGVRVTDLTPFSRRKLAPPIIFNATNRVFMPVGIKEFPWADAEFVDRLFSRSKDWKVRSQSDETHTVFALDVPREKKVCVIEIVKVIPAKSDAKVEGAVRQMLEQAGRRDFRRIWFSRESIAARAAAGS